LKIAYKVWLDNNGKAFGEGPYQLLKRIETTGSLHQAAIEMKMSYRKAWTTLKAIETKLGFALLERKVGGIAGGGSHITEQGRLLMSHYEEFRRELTTTLEIIYQKHFGNWINHECETLRHQ
jgi:molybdate transport system regulatory protein